jgi:hypothetical protein
MAFALTADDADRPGPERHVMTAHRGTNADLIPQVARLYLPAGARVADVTYGQGIFWSKVDLRAVTLIGSDAKMPTILHRTQRPLFADAAPVLLAADFTALPYRAASVDIVVFDPPYQHNPSTREMERTYRNLETSRGMYHHDILRDFYCHGLQEAWRVVRPGGLVWVKGKDEIESGTQCWSHAEVRTAAERLAFVALDQFFLVTQCSITLLPNGIPQRHARKNQSWLWVFRRPQAVPVPTRGRPKKGSVVPTHKQQRGRSYWQSRLLRERPDVYACYMAGELGSVHAAARAAGLVQPRQRTGRTAAD